MMVIRGFVVASLGLLLVGASTAFGQGFGRATFGRTPAAPNTAVPTFGSLSPQQNQRSGTPGGFNLNNRPGNLPTQPDFLSRPAVSPFVRLLNSSTPTTDFFTIVRPEQQFRRAANEQAQALQRLNRENQQLQENQRETNQARDPGRGNPANVSTGAGLGLRPTGHTTTFGNTMGFFPGLP